MLGICTHKATQLLIASYTQLKEEFRGSTRKKKDCWLHVSEAMSVYGYNVSASECDRKWRSLLKTYRCHLDQTKKSRHGGGENGPILMKLMALWVPATRGQLSLPSLQGR